MRDRFGSAAAALAPLLAACAICVSCTGGGEARMNARMDQDGATAGALSLDPIAETYVRLALAVGEHEPAYIDAYFGPPEWREREKRERRSLEAIARTAGDALARLEAIDLSGRDEIVQLRRRFLARSLESLIARTRMLRGERFTFDEESRAIYDVVAPPYDEAGNRAIIARLDSIVPPGEGTLLDRIERFRKGFVVPRERLDTVFTVAIAEARARTRRHLDLPANESFTVAYVTGKSWGAYNWYQGGCRSLIEVNTDLPTYIDSPIGLACHEGYPGHHVYNALLESRLLKGRGWIEYCVGPLHCPQSPISEGTANYGIELAFPGEERIAFERDVLFPLAGLDPSRAALYYEIRELQGKLRGAQNEAARRYLDGAMTADETAAWLCERALMSRERAAKRVTFIDEFRSYVVTYNVGQDIVRNYIEKRAASADDRWKLFGEILSTPRVPSDLQ